MDPLWTPDGKDVLFLSDRNGAVEVFRRRADGTQRAESIVRVGQNATLSSVSPDGKILLYDDQRSGTGRDIMQVSLVGEANSVPLLASVAAEQHAHISPDGRWLAYASTELGEREILVRPFPDVDGGGPYRISLNGGEEPLWSPRGDAIYYRQGNTFRRASLEVGAAVVVTRRDTLFEGAGFLRSLEFRVNTYAIDPDGERFLMIRDVDGDDRNREIVVVQDWLAEIADRLPKP